MLMFHPVPASPVASPMYAWITISSPSAEDAGSNTVAEVPVWDTLEPLARHAAIYGQAPPPVCVHTVVQLPFGFRRWQRYVLGVGVGVAVGAIVGVLVAVTGGIKVGVLVAAEVGDGVADAAVVGVAENVGVEVGEDVP